MENQLKKQLEKNQWKIKLNIKHGSWGCERSDWVELRTFRKGRGPWSFVEALIFGCVFLSGWVSVISGLLLVEPLFVRTGLIKRNTVLWQSAPPKFYGLCYDDLHSVLAKPTQQTLAKASLRC